VELAKTTKTPILFMDAEIPVEVAQPITTADAPVVIQMKQTPVKAFQPTGQQVELAAVVTPPPAAEFLPDPAPVAMLPPTAGSLPLIALFGLLALGGALGLGLLQKRIV
jgi:hypothetical protein